MKQTRSADRTGGADHRGQTDKDREREQDPYVLPNTKKAMSSPPRWSEQEVEILRAEWKTSKPTREIAERLGRPSIESGLHQSPPPRAPQERRPEQNQAVTKRPMVAPAELPTHAHEDLRLETRHQPAVMHPAGTQARSREDGAVHERNAGHSRHGKPRRVTSPTVHTHPKE